MPTKREIGWKLFDQITASAARRDANPWQLDTGILRHEPDYDTLSLLLGVPQLLKASSQSGVPALAFDVWVSYELRRAGFDPDRVWPRPVAPRVLSPELLDFLNALPARERKPLLDRIAERGTGGSASANILGKNYVKQVDVVMSSWATGPELMISTKRMDSSFGKNAANRVEESYGDAKNLRLRHPQAALGFVYGLSALALQLEPLKTAWLIDLLAKLGREDDAYHAVALVLPDLSRDEEPDTEDPEPTVPLTAGQAELATEAALHEETTDEDDSQLTRQDVSPVGLYQEEVPHELDPGRFFSLMCDRVLSNSPINFHETARELRLQAR